LGFSDSKKLKMFVLNSSSTSPIITQKKTGLTLWQSFSFWIGFAKRLNKAKVSEFLH